MKPSTITPSPFDDLSFHELSLVTGGDADPGGDVLGSTFQEPDQTFGRGDDSTGMWG